MENPLEGTVVTRGYMFHSEIFIDGKFSHNVIGGKKRYIHSLIELHGFLWKPPSLTSKEIRELCPELTKEESKKLKKSLKVDMSRFDPDTQLIERETG